MIHTHSSDLLTGESLPAEKEMKVNIHYSEEIEQIQKRRCLLGIVNYVRRSETAAREYRPMGIKKVGVSQKVSLHMQNLDLLHYVDFSSSNCKVEYCLLNMLALALTAELAG